MHIVQIFVYVVSQPQNLGVLMSVIGNFITVAQLVILLEKSDVFHSLVWSCVFDHGMCAKVSESIIEGEAYGQVVKAFLILFYLKGTVAASPLQLRFLGLQDCCASEALKKAEDIIDAWTLLAASSMMRRV